MAGRHAHTKGTASPAALYGDGRMSPQRAAIGTVVDSMRHAFTAEDLHREVARTKPGIGLATVYRAIGAMQAAGALVAVGEREGSTLLARCARHDHHHHLLCTECGMVLAVDCPVDDAAMRATVSGGHVVTGHQITLYGICAECRVRTKGA